MAGVVATCFALPNVRCGRGTHRVVPHANTSPSQPTATLLTLWHILLTNFFMICFKVYLNVSNQIIYFYTRHSTLLQFIMPSLALSTNLLTLCKVWKCYLYADCVIVWSLSQHFVHLESDTNPVLPHARWQWRWQLQQCFTNVFCINHLLFLCVCWCSQ